MVGLKLAGPNSVELIIDELINGVADATFAALSAEADSITLVAFAG